MVGVECSNIALTDRANGAVLFAYISGFTASTQALRNTLGPQRRAEELTRRMEAVYSTLIGEANTIVAV
jgi:hypothetical protein